MEEEVGSDLRGSPSPKSIRCFHSRRHFGVSIKALAVRSVSRRPRFAEVIMQKAPWEMIPKGSIAERVLYCRAHGHFWVQFWLRRTHRIEWAVERLGMYTMTRSNSVG